MKTVDEAMNFYCGLHGVKVVNDRFERVKMKTQRLYTIYSREVKDGKKVWKRESDTFLPIEGARRVFQTRLINGSMGIGPLLELRPVVTKVARYGTIYHGCEYDQRKGMWEGVPEGCTTREYFFVR